MARLMITPMKIAMIGSTTTSRSDSWGSVRTAMKIPPTIRIGAEMMTVSDMKTSVWTWRTSFVLRVMSDGEPNRLTSAWENVSTFEKIELRTSRPKPIATCAPRNTPATAVTAEQPRHEEHHPADPEDVLRVARDDAVVDDVGVEVRQVQVADRLDEEQDQDDDDPAGVRRGGRSGAAGSRLCVRGTAHRGPATIGLPADSRDRQLGPCPRHRPKPDEEALQLIVRQARPASSRASPGGAPRGQ